MYKVVGTYQMVLSFLCSVDLELSNSIIDILLFLFKIIWIVSVG